MRHCSTIPPRPINPLQTHWKYEHEVQEQILINEINEYMLLYLVQLNWGLYCAKTELSLSFLSCTCQLRNNSSSQINCCFPFIPHLFCCQSLSWTAHTKLMLQHIDTALSLSLLTASVTVLLLILHSSLHIFLQRCIYTGYNQQWNQLLCRLRGVLCAGLHGNRARRGHQ